MEIGTKMGFTLGLRWGKKEEGMLVDVKKWGEMLFLMKSVKMDRIIEYLWLLYLELDFRIRISSL
jgi:hypothetical protein